jgi:hypothetical protein
VLLPYQPREFQVLPRLSVSVTVLVELSVPTSATKRVAPVVFTAVVVASIVPALPKVTLVLVVKVIAACACFAWSPKQAIAEPMIIMIEMCRSRDLRSMENFRWITVE